VADELGLPEGLVPYLGAALKRYRDPLAKLLENGVGKVRVDDWERTLGAALCCDPWIRPFAHQRFGCTNAHVVECLP